MGTRVYVFFVVVVVVFVFLFFAVSFIQRSDVFTSYNLRDSDNKLAIPLLWLQWCSPLEQSTLSC